MGTRFLALALSMAAACVTSPEVPDPGNGATLPQIYADVLLNFTVGGQFAVCRKELPPCEEPLDTPCDEPENMPEALAVLGEPDGASFDLGMDGRLDIGIHCGAITEAGPLIIHTTMGPEEHADVFVSLDGIYYTHVGVLEDGDNLFNLTTFEIHSARYVRVFDTGGGSISIDGIEGTWSGDPQ